MNTLKNESAAEASAIEPFSTTESKADVAAPPASGDSARSLSAVLTPPVLAAFACVYVIWGSTYLAIRYALISFPPWTMTGLRFCIAGVLMAVIAKWLRKEARLSRDELKLAAISGALMMSANALVGVVEQWIASGTVAVMIGVMPIWIMLLGWIFFGTGRPASRKLAGALVGLLGIVLIAADTGHTGPANSSLLGVGLLILSNVLWATGTLLQKKLGAVKNLFTFSATQMFLGGLFSAVLAFAFENPVSSLSTPIAQEAWYALIYLIVFGSLIGYTSYSYLSRTVEPHFVSTYALVNPVIAVLLGSLIAAEPISMTFVMATGFVLAGLALLLMPRLRRRSN